MDTYSLGFSMSNLGPKSFQKVLNKFGDSKKAWNATELEFQQIGIAGLTYKKFDAFRKTFDSKKYAQKLEKEKAEFVSFLDKQYPNELKKLPDPPIGLFLKGNATLLKQKPIVAVVGTRKITEYGKSVTESIVSELASNNVVIVSGLALGVDAKAHRVSIQNNGMVIAVLACGVDCCLPSENYNLYSDILKNNGLIISEYPLSQPPNKGTFLARNRIVAALSEGVLITEASEDSGSLVTAEWGFRLSKKVFAVPGPIRSVMMQGSLKLLKNGARLVTDGEDIIKELNIKKKFTKSEKELNNLNTVEKKIVLSLENGELSIDEISKKMNIPVVEIAMQISQLELRGLLKNSNGKISRRYE